MNNNYKTLVSTLMLGASSVAMANDDLIDFSALTGEYVASNPGLEAIVPSWTRVDNDSNGTQDGYNFHFDVYQLGTKTNLFSTPNKYLAVGIPACIGQSSADTQDFDFKRIGKNIILTF